MDQSEENFSPVCAFSTVRFFLVSAMMLGWMTHSADFASAFTQAELEEPLHMSTPRGFRNKCGNEGCLRLRRNLCSSRLAPKNWHSHLRAAHIHQREASGCVARSVAGSVQLVVDLGTRCGEELLNTNVLNDDASTFIRRVCWIHWHKYPSLMAS